MSDTLLKWLLIGTNIILLFICCLLTWNQMKVMPQNIVQLSVRSLFDDFMKDQTENADRAVIEANTVNYSRELNNILKELSERENIVILVSEAVLSEHVLDITPEIKVLLERRLKERAGFRIMEKGAREDG